MKTQKQEKITIKSKLFDYEHTNPSGNGWKIILGFLIGAVIIAIVWICKHG
jgi:hypothetical protein